MKTKKLLALLMAGTMSVSMLSGCGGNNASSVAPAYFCLDGIRIQE